MAICASCSLEVARDGFSKAQLGKKDARRCRQCVRDQEPDAPTAVAPPSTRGKTTSDVEVRTCAGCSMELTGAHRNECGRFNECALCKERRIPKPALYCGRSCALQHWKKGHKEWHEKVKVISDDMAANSRDTDEEVRRLIQERNPESSLLDIKYISWCDRSEQERTCGNHREAQRLARKAIAWSMQTPGCEIFPDAHYHLGMAYSRSGDDDNAVPHLQKAMELSDTGTKYHAWMSIQHGRGNASDVHCDEAWSLAASQLFMCFVQSSCTVPRPAWFYDTEQLKRMAERAVSGQLNGTSLQMRAGVCEDQDEPSTADLRQALQDRQRILEMFTPEGSSAAAAQQRMVQRLNSKLRAFIAMDVVTARMVAAAATAAPDAAPSSSKSSRSHHKSVVDYSKWDSLTLSDDSD